MFYFYFFLTNMSFNLLHCKYAVLLENNMRKEFMAKNVQTVFLFYFFKLLSIYASIYSIFSHEQS